MLKYLDDIYSYSSQQINQQNLDFFFQDKEGFKKVREVIYQPMLAKEMYDDAVEVGFQPLVDAAKEALEGSIQNVKLLLNQ